MTKTQTKNQLVVDIFTPYLRWKSLDFSIEPHIENTLYHALNYITLPECISIVSPEVSVVLANDSMLSALNREYKNKKGPTNVLSFPQIDENSNQHNISTIGDIVLSLDTIMTEAEEQNKKLEDHITHLLVHGFLHLVGYDHENEQDASVMEALEIDILKDLGIDNPYKDFN
jgi:probable rRNA maturation factor